MTKAGAEAPALPCMVVRQRDEDRSPLPAFGSDICWRLGAASIVVYYPKCRHRFVYLGQVNQQPRVSGPSAAVMVAVVGPGQHRTVLGDQLDIDVTGNGAHAVIWLVYFAIHLPSPVSTLDISMNMGDGRGLGLYRGRAGPGWLAASRRRINIQREGRAN